MNPFIKFILIIISVFLPPIFGVYVTDGTIEEYLKFPPYTKEVIHSPFSFPIFICFVIVETAIFYPFIKLLADIFKRKSFLTNFKKPFPSWGYVSLLSLLIFWILAWSRFDWFSHFQNYTFTPLWISYIFLINAITYAKYGESPLTKSPSKFSLLFLVSAVFWWTFEYLNRFVQNWYYINVNKTAIAYIIHASISFSTVLPAVLSTKELLINSSFIKSSYRNLKRVKLPESQLGGIFFLFACWVSLFFMPIFPEYLFFKVWISPLFAILGIQLLSKEKHVFSDLSKGNWCYVVSYCCAALICGFFWEMWNFYSFAKWKYSIPFVNKFHIFEMPILGYAGYIPFGLICGGFLQMLRLDKT